MLQATSLYNLEVKRRKERGERIRKNSKKAWATLDVGGATLEEP